MIEALVTAALPGIHLRHVRMQYSKELLETGRLAVRKFAHLASVVARVWWVQARFRPDIVYYPPGGPNRAPMARDVITLLAIRPFSRRLVLHFHAAGVSEVWERGIRPRIFRAMFERAFFEADAAIMISSKNPPDGPVLRAKRTYYVSNGVPDEQPTVERLRRSVAPHGELRVLFVGAVIEAKGATDLAEAAVTLWDSGQRFRLDYVGEYSPDMAGELRRLSGRHSQNLALHGVLSGDLKWERFAAADIFCFPTFFEAESQGIVAIEAMMCSLPVVATRWRGLSEVVVDGRTGYLVECRDHIALAERLAGLLADTASRASMGAAGRARYEQEYSMSSHLERMHTVFVETAATPRRQSHRPSAPWRRAPESRP